MSSLRVVVFGFLASTCTVSAAAGAASRLTGFYAGLEGGGSVWRFKPKLDGASSDEGFKSKMLGRAGASVGGGKEFGPGVYLGGQIGGGGLFGSYKVEEKGDYVRFNPGYYYDADLRVGYAMTSGCLLYLSGGFEGQGTKFEQKVDESGWTLDWTGGGWSQVPYGTVGLGMRYQLANGIFVEGTFKAMFGTKSTWKVGKKSKIAPELQGIEKVDFYTEKGKVDYELVKAALQLAELLGGDTLGITTDGKSLMKEGQPLNPQGEKAVLQLAQKNAQQEIDRLKALVKESNSGKLKQKFCLQNYAFAFSVGYRF